MGLLRLADQTFMKKWFNEVEQVDFESGALSEAIKKIC